jgi:seryl-tRNA synthetase
MIDIKLIRNNKELIKKTLKNHTKEGVDSSLLDKFEKIDSEWKKNSTNLQALNTKRNEKSKEISILLKEKKNAEAEKIKKEVSTMKDEIEKLNEVCNKLEKDLKTLLFSFPNILDDKVPLGGEEKNKVIKEKKPKKMNFKPLSHKELGVKHD